MGGALAQCLFGEDPPPDRVVLMATPDRIEDRKGKWILPLIRHLRLQRRWIYLKERGSDIALAEERERIVNYRWVPLESLSELDALLKRVRRNRRPAPVPTLILHGIHDHTAPFSHALRLRRELGRSATLIALPRSYHVLTRDREKEDLARVTLAFLEGTPPYEIPLPRGWVRYPPLEEPPAR
jgi:esterase/lipase